MEEKNTTRKKKNAGLPWEAWKKRAALLTAGGGSLLICMLLGCALLDLAGNGIYISISLLSGLYILGVPAYLTRTAPRDSGKKWLTGEWAFLILFLLNILIYLIMTLWWSMALGLISLLMKGGGPEILTPL